MSDIKFEYLELLDSFLKKARGRSNLVFVAFLLSIYTFVLGIRSDKTDHNEIQNAAELFATIDEKAIQSLLKSTYINEWLASNRDADLNMLEYNVRKIGTELNQSGLNGDDFYWYVSTTELSSYFTFNVPRLSEKFPDSLENWSYSQLSALGQLLTMSALPEWDEKNLAKLDSQITQFAKADLSSALKSRLDSVQQRIRAFRPKFLSTELVKSKYSRVLQDSGKLTRLAKVCEKFGYESSRPLLETSSAEKAISLLERDSISFFGFNLPGFLLILLIPSLTLVLSAECYFYLKQSASFAFANLEPGEIRSYASLFPWYIFSLLSSDKKFVDLVGKGIFYLPVLALILLPIGLNASLIYKAISLGIIIVIAAIQFHSLKIIGLLFTGAEKRQRVMKIQSVPPRAKMLTRHARGVLIAWNIAQVSSTTISVFFLSMVFIPKDLLTDKSAVLKAHTQRVKLESIYHQRFIENADEFKVWTESAFEELRSLAMLDMMDYTDARLDTLLKLFCKEPPLADYVHSIYGFMDEVLDSKTRLSEMKMYMIKDIVHVTYQESLDPLADNYGALVEYINGLPLSNGDREKLPDQLKQTVIPGMTLPTPFPYRTLIERGGFARFLIPLPPRDSMSLLINIADSLRIESIAGFDRYVHTIKKLDSSLGKSELQIFGITIDRTIIKEASYAIILGSLLLLAIQLHLFKVVSKRLTASEFTYSLYFPSLFFHSDAKGGKIQQWLVQVSLVLWPLIVLYMIGSTTIDFRDAWFNFEAIFTLAVLVSIVILYQRFRIIQSINIANIKTFPSPGEQAVKAPTDEESVTR